MIWPLWPPPGVSDLGGLYMGSGVKIPGAPLASDPCGQVLGSPRTSGAHQIPVVGAPLPTDSGVKAGRLPSPWSLRPHSPTFERMGGGLVPYGP